MRDIQFAEYGQTTLSASGLAFMALMVLMILLLERRAAYLPIVLTACLIPYDLRIVVIGIDFDMLRLLVLFGWVRVVMRREWRSLTLNRLDWLFLVWAVFSILPYTVLRKSTDALIQRTGYAFNAAGIYFLTRVLLRDFRDVTRSFQYLLIAAIPLATGMLIEQLTARNFFANFGGVGRWTVMREGRLRSQGSFSHPILAGTFGGFLLPLAWGLWHQGDNYRRLAWVGTFLSFVIVVASSSSGPIITLAAAMGALYLWRLRHQLHVLRRALVVGTIALHIVMKAPVWALIARVSAVGGSTGYHRYILLDQFIRRAGEWWLLGVSSTYHWGWGLQDVTNMYVRIGIDGGIVSLILFLAVISRSFRYIGETRRALPLETGQRLVWALGAMMLAHVVSFIGVTYFGKAIFFWCYTVAATSALFSKGRESVIVERKVVSTTFSPS